MAELKLCTVWKIKDFGKQPFRINMDNGMCFFESDELTDLSHLSLPGLKWEANLQTAWADEAPGTNGFASFYLYAHFGDAATDAKYAWANYRATLLNVDDQDAAVFATAFTREFTSQDGGGKHNGWGRKSCFKIDDISKAVRKDDSLCIRIDLTVVDVGEILRCRTLLRGLLANETLTDFNVKVGEETFKLHKSVMAEASSVFDAMFASGMEEARDGVLTLADTTPAAFKAFKEAVYFDNWDFLADADRTQEVLYLADKYNVDNLKSYCDGALAAKVHEANALDILSNNAALWNASKTQTACIGILANHMEFTESHTWLDFKSRNHGIALEIMDMVSDKWIDAHKQESNPAALKAFTQAVYFDNCDFLSDVNLTQDVLHLAVKHNVAPLQLRCDHSLAAMVNETNALEVLMKTAVPCNAAETQIVCTDILAEHSEFSVSQAWLEFKNHNQELAWDICGIVMRKMRLSLESIKSQQDTTNAGLKRKCEETVETSSSKRHKE